MSLRAAVVGLGVGERHITGFEADRRCRVVSLCDIDPGKLAEVGGRNPGKTLTTDPWAVIGNPDIDVVSIASYDDAHHAQVMAALAAGQHIFVEKPLCLHDHELADIRQALADRPELKLSSNLILRRSPRFANLKRRIDSGEMGRIYYVEGDYNYGRLHKILNSWRGQIPFYSVVHGGGIHMIDLLMWLTGSRPLEVSAFGTKLASEDSGFRFNDTVVAILRFEDGSVGKVTCNFPCVFPHFHNVSVYGTEASFLHGHGGARLFRSRDPEAMPEAIDDGYPGAAKGDMIPAFVAAILDGAEPEVPKQAVLDCMAVSLAIERAAETGQIQKVLYE